ncbi:MAG: DUF5906 domain-containing protein [Phycisphaerales bacterium]
MVEPRYDLSVDFLQRWCPGGQHVLTAISVDKKQIETRTFRDPAEVLKWLGQHGDRNRYFSVNPCLHDVSKKPGNEDIKSLDWIHVDIDPRSGEDLATEQRRILSLLQNPPQGIPKPTVIVFSGGGYAAYWKLVNPVEINGEEARYEDAKRYNLAIELALGGDHCHDVSRIMRLPGTINRPDERKRKKGQTEALAELIEWDDSRVYPLSQFTQAPALQTEATGFGTVSPVKISGNIERINNINDLPGLSDLSKVVIVQGCDPDNPSRFPSRSEALFFVCCEMVRADLSDDVIFSVITDPDFLISTSVLDKGRGIEGYAKRQIERAREEAVDPHLRELNDKYAVVSYGGKTRVAYEDYDEALERYRLVVMTLDDFRSYYMNRRVSIGTDAQGNPRYEPLGQWWLKHEKRRQYEGITFAPERESRGKYNMWRGFAYEPIAGDKHQPLLDHVRENVCGGDDKLYDYLVDWMAFAVQHPDQQGQTAIVMRGQEGVGKGFLARHFGRLFGRHFLHVSQANHLIGNFNAHLRDCSVLFVDEAFFAGDKKHVSVLKALISERTFVVEPKGIDAQQARNYLHVIMASNDDWVVPAGPDARRYCVLDVSDKHMQDRAYFKAIAEALRAGGYGNLLHFLKTRDLSHFDVTAVPQTEALQDQKEYTFNEPWKEVLAPLIEGKEGKLLAEEVWKQVGLGRDSNGEAKRTQEHKERLGRVMKAYGYKSKQLRFDGNLLFCYVRGEFPKGAEPPTIILPVPGCGGLP